MNIPTTLSSVMSRTAASKRTIIEDADDLHTIREGFDPHLRQQYRLRCRYLLPHVAHLHGRGQLDRPLDNLCRDVQDLEEVRGEGSKPVGPIGSSTSTGARTPA